MDYPRLGTLPLLDSLLRAPSSCNVLKEAISGSELGFILLTCRLGWPLVVLHVYLFILRKLCAETSNKARYFTIQVGNA